LIFLIDLSEDNYQEAFDVLYRELSSFSEELVKKPRAIAGTKLDLDGTGERLQILRDKYAGERVLGVSVFSGEGIPQLAGLIAGLVQELQDDTPEHAAGKGAAGVKAGMQGGSDA
jgi:GTP-binding protein